MTGLNLSYIRKTRFCSSMKNFTLCNVCVCVSENTKTNFTRTKKKNNRTRKGQTQLTYGAIDIVVDVSPSALVAPLLPSPLLL